MYKLDYFYFQEANQFAFFRIPKLLFTDIRFSSISTDAKLLYGLMLDRMSLSIMNKWLDDHGRVYIYFTLEDAQDMMQISTGKAVKLFAELDSGKGVGLIERKKQGQGRPTIIYLKNFASVENPGEPPAGKEKADLQNLQVKTSKKSKPRLPESESLDLQKLEGNKTEYNKTENNNQSIRAGEAEQASPALIVAPCSEGLMDGYRDKIKTNIEYDLLTQHKDVDSGMLDEIVELMVCTLIDGNVLIKIGSQEYPNSYVKKRLLSMDSGHIEYVLDSLVKNTTKIYNIKAYLLATLFNAPVTMENYYAAAVQHDLYGGGMTFQCVR
ncbi:replication initiator protein A [Ruminococcaceae bacterium OttesenSCG-928-A11]|nr:replication initiator protein A [Ruminococcaceae bacterium OttesenSCG-928-A11]